MKSHLLTALDELEAIPWYEHLGQPAIDTETIFVRDMKLAFESLRSPEWTGFKLMLRNRNYRDAARADYHGFKLWDSLARDAWPRVDGVIKNAQAKLKQNPMALSGDLSVIGTDIWALAFELTYKETCPLAAWRNRLLPVLNLGRMPCGWVGPEIDERWAGASDDPLPAGKLLVF